ncbi:MAG: acetate--CoA ligase family protein [Flavobacteriales bacterium]|nr:acetate--CoA ligase family protein [Flavobacteriales bacterium]
MLNQELLNPRSIAVVGGSNDVRKPGGKVLSNLVSQGYAGEIFVVNARDHFVQGITCHRSVFDLPNTDLAIIAIPAESCPEVVRELASNHSTRAFIVLSAGFGEAGERGRRLENELVEIVNEFDACLIGPNCIGVLNANYKGVFTTPVPKLEPGACDLISGSGATAVFLMEAGKILGLRFSNVYSVGNSAQTGVEDILEYMDLNYDPAYSAPIKLLYIETLKDPRRFLRHASSLVRKGARIAAIKAGLSREGSRAASSHTGAIASSGMAIRALFRKAGIVFCSSREELLSVASIFRYKKPEGKRIAIITHAGGSAVMLADVLSEGGLEIPDLTGPESLKLASFLHPGSSVTNPIDFLATGNADQLGIIIDFCEHKFQEIDAMVVVFGSAGLFDVENVYNVLSVKLEVCKKPIYPVLPSVVNAEREIQSFLEKGHVNFPDEVVLGRALCAVLKTPEPAAYESSETSINGESIREVIRRSENGYLSPAEAGTLLDAVGVPRAAELLCSSESQLRSELTEIAFPLVLKVVGPVHKTEVDGVILNISNSDELISGFNKLMMIDGAEAVLLQPMYSGYELYVGAVSESGFGHIIVAGFGGVYMEVWRDVRAALAPISENEAKWMISSLNGAEVLRGYRGKKGVNIAEFERIIRKISELCLCAPEIAELDINPIIATDSSLIAVDSRIRIDKNSI